MKLASLKQGGRDGTLIVVNHDLSMAVVASGIAPTTTGPGFCRNCSYSAQNLSAWSTVQTECVWPPCGPAPGISSKLSLGPVVMTR